MVLGPDLVRARRRGERLFVAELVGEERAMAREMALQMLALAQEGEGRSMEELEVALGHVERPPKLEKVWAGLKKVILDACESLDLHDPEPTEVRRSLFLRSARARMELPDDGVFEREHVVSAVAAELGKQSTDIEDAMFADLKGAQPLRRAPSMDADALLEAYDLEHLQGVLLRTVKLTAELRAADPGAYRRLFSKLKFRNLLFRLSELLAGGYRIEIEGPFSLFEAVTKYGMQFALVVPALLECGSGTMVADVRWGKERRALSFEKSWQPSTTTGKSAGPEAVMRPEIEQLLAAIRKKGGPFEVTPCAELLHIPGAGLCVTDLKFSAPGRPNVYLELMGFWSRDAVWKRVEWSQAGPHERVIFAASSRLRVSEQVLPTETGANLYVFKGALSASSVLERVEALSQL